MRQKKIPTNLYQLLAQVCITTVLGILVFNLTTNLAKQPEIEIAQASSSPLLEFRGGRFYLNSEREVLKIAHLLVDFTKDYEVNRAISLLPQYKQKNYNAIQTTLYWQYFDNNWDGKIDRYGALSNARKFLQAATDQGFYIVLSTETYPVGGSLMSESFFNEYPAARAKNYDGSSVYDTEYKPNGNIPPVPSFLNPEYLLASRSIVRDLLERLPLQNVVMYETTVEPQYIGNQAIDYSDNALAAYSDYAGQVYTFDNRPDPSDPSWNVFRAVKLAEWIDGDIKNLRNVIPDAVVAVDFLYLGDESQLRRTGYPEIFLQYLREADVLQINWHYGYCKQYRGLYTPAKCNEGYELARKYAHQKGWGLMEHMGISGDLVDMDMAGIINNSIANGNTIGWNTVDAFPKPGSAFTVYNMDLTPKGDVADFDDNWPAYRSQLLQGSYDARLVGKAFRSWIGSHYWGFLNRTVERDGYLSGRANLADGLSCKDYSYMLFASEEFKLRLPTLDSAEYVRAIYKGLLGRHPNDQEIKLGLDKNQGQLFAEILRSPEYKNRCYVLGFNYS